MVVMDRVRLPQRMIGNARSNWADLENWKKIAGIGAVLLTLGAVGAFGNLLKPDESVGLAPQKIDRRDFALTTPMDYSGLARSPQTVEEIRAYEKGLQIYSSQLWKIENQEREKIVLLEAYRLRQTAIAEANTGTIIKPEEPMGYVNAEECARDLKRNYACVLFRGMEDQARAMTKAAAIFEDVNATSEAKRDAFDLHSRASLRLRALIYALYPPTFQALQSEDTLKAYSDQIRGFYQLLKLTPQIGSAPSPVEGDPGAFNFDYSAPKALDGGSNE